MLVVYICPSHTLRRTFLRQLGETIKINTLFVAHILMTRTWPLWCFFFLCSTRRVFHELQSVNELHWLSVWHRNNHLQIYRGRYLCEGFINDCDNGNAYRPHYKTQRRRNQGGLAELASSDTALPNCWSTCRWGSFKPTFPDKCWHFSVLKPRRKACYTSSNV